MDLQQMIDTILENAELVGTFTLPDVFRIAAEKGTSGLAVVREAGTLACLVLVRGEPEGAIFADGKGGTLWRQCRDPGHRPGRVRALFR